MHLHTGRHLRLPADYVAEHVQLGYATTVHGAQGVTADTAHTVAAGAESRQQLYVALTRGRQANHLYLNAAMDGDEHSIITPAATHPETALNILEQILARDEAQPSATTSARRVDEPGIALTQATARYLDSLHTAAADLLGADQMRALEAHVDNLAPGILDSPAWPTLRGHLTLLAAEGHNPAARVHHRPAGAGDRHRRRRRRRPRLAPRPHPHPLHRPRAGPVAAGHPRTAPHRPHLGSPPGRTTDPGRPGHRPRPRTRPAS